MKRIFLLLSMSCMLALSAHSQEFKKFKVGIGAGYATASGKGAKGGVVGAIEPAYRISDIVQVGLRWEGAAIVRGASMDLGMEPEIATNESLTLNGQYYFSNDNFRPFVGAGFGLYSMAAVKVGESFIIEIAAPENKLGFYPRVGFDAGHFTLSIDYNLIPATKIDGGEFKNNYLGFRIGGFFGGGRK